MHVTPPHGGRDTPMKPAQPPSLKRYATEWMTLGLALALAAVLIVYELQQGRAGIDTTEHERLAVQARVIEDNLAQQLDGINKALASLRAEYARPPAERTANTSARLKILSDAIPGVRNMFLIDASGTVIASSEAALLGRSCSEREFFRVPNQARIGETLYVSPPFQSLLGHLVIAVSRVLHGPSGEFEGLVVAGLDTRYFEVVMRSVLYAHDMQAALAHADGKIFLATPQGTALPALKSRMSEIAEAMREGGATPWVDGATHDDSGSIIAVREVAPAALQMDRPLVIAVGRSADAVFRAWRQHAVELGGFFSAVFLAASLGLHRSQRRRREFDELDAVAATERRLGAERLELALRGAELGLWDWDVPNDRFNHNELTRLRLGYAPDEIGLDGKAWRALFHADDAERVMATIEAHFDSRTEAYECEFRIRHKAGHAVWLLSRGKVVERDADGRPLRMAGTHMDITDRKRIELELQRLNERLTQLSTTDGLTEVGNRRLFDQTLSAEWARAARKRDRVALLMIDIDHFKDYNDAYGHPAGDECLRRVARIVSETVKREGELVARYGGEEFALLLPGADLASARVVAERCLAALAEARIEHRQSPTSQWVTMSDGIADAVAAPGTLPTALVEAADAALYRAKRAGRSRLEI